MAQKTAHFSGSVSSIDSFLGLWRIERHNPSGNESVYDA